MHPKTVYVLDTNVLLYDPDILNAYPGAEVIIPIDVIEEIDKFKKTLSETGNSARTIAKMLDQYRLKGNLSEGIKLPNHSQLRIAFPAHSQKSDEHVLDWNKTSNRVLGVALKQKQEGTKVILVTLDTHLRIKGNAFGIEVMHGPGEQELSFSPYPGIRYQNVSADTLCLFRQQERLEPEEEFAPHEGMLLINQDHPDDYEIAIFDPIEQLFARVNHSKGVWNLIPRNAEQHLALELLLDPRISIVSLVGKAGTGKTLLALAAGLQMMLVENQYKRLLVSRPIFPMGRDLGYLPGDLQEKLAPWMQPIFDNLELLMGTSESVSNSSTSSYHELIEQGLLIIEPLTYIRGRSIPHQYLIVDEAQNLTPHEIKTIITRAGEGTKVILTGDPDQIDNPYVDKISNGLSYIVGKFRDHRLAGHMTLKRGERSQLAELAANIL
ncbi:MAG: PhoH family protein [SAR324 cluster bacterium]|nr:PhoH family protein [SAR324 cluster bacterium]